MHGTLALNSGPTTETLLHGMVRISPTVLFVGIENCVCTQWQAGASWKTIAESRAVGADIRELLPHKFVDSVLELGSRYTSLDSAQVHEMTIELDGRLRQVAVWSVNQSEGKFFLILRDITKIKKIRQTEKASESARSRLAVLSPRENQVMQLITVGDSNKLVAKKLAINIKTIEKHRANMMRKLNVRTFAEVVRLVHTATDWPIE